MVRPLPYLLSQYAWLIIFGLFLLIGIFITPKRSVGPIHSNSPSNPWNPSLLPRIVAHLTDIHLNSWLTNASNRVDAVFPQIESLGADPVLISGDLVDDRPDDFHVGQQEDQDWKYYDLVLNRTRFRGLIDIAGNHDEFGIARFNSPRHNVLTMSRYFRGRSEASLSDFWISSNVSVLENREAVEVVSIVPLRYPTPHAKLGFWIYPTREMLDAIEAGLEGPSAGVRIVQCHFPVNLWSTTTRSKSGRTIGEILARGNVSLVLTGHLHPERPMFLHTDGVLEVVGPDLRWHERFGMVTVDNGRVVYHEVPLGETPFAVVSHPVPRTQLSTATAFAEQATEVRVIVFSGREDLSIFVSGAVNDRLNFTAKIAENVSLYTCPLEAMKRSTPYKLTFSGDWKSEMEFSIADYVSDLPDEAIYGFQNWQITAYVALGGLFTFLLVITFPFGRLEFAEQCAAWIAERSSEPHWFVAVCCGFLVTRERLRRAPAFLRAALFVATLWTACGPLIFIKIENLFGMIWIWGFLVDGIQHYDFYGPVFAAIYLATIVLPLVSATSQFGFRQWELIFIADYLVLATGIGGSIAVGYIWVVSAAGLLGVLTSPAYIIAPICLIVLFVIGMIKKRKELPATLSGIWSDLNSGPNQ